MNKPSKRSKKNDDKSAVAMLKKHELNDRTEKPFESRHTHHAQGHGPVVVFHRIHDSRVASFRMWSRRSYQFYGRAQTYGNQSNVSNSRKLLQVTLKFETKILHSDTFSQVDLISKVQTLQNFRIGVRRRQNGKSKVPAKQRGSWPKKRVKIKGTSKSNILLTFAKTDACLHQILNMRNENMLSTPERRCI